MRSLLRAVLYGLFRLLTRLEVIGMEQIPARGGCLVAANHLSILDGPLVFALLQRDDATGLAARKHQRNRFFRWVVNQVGGIWIDQNSADLAALKQARSHLRAGGLLGITPEGTRSPTGALIEAKPGVAFLASQADIPLIPAAITGTETALGLLRRWRRPQIKVIFGAPFYLPPLPRGEREAGLQANTDEIMCRIAALLPEQYRGVYVNHPRLHELLQAEQPGGA